MNLYLTCFLLSQEFIRQQDWDQNSEASTSYFRLASNLHYYQFRINLDQSADRDSNIQRITRRGNTQPSANCFGKLTLTFLLQKLDFWSHRTSSYGSRGYSHTLCTTSPATASLNPLPTFRDGESTRSSAFRNRPVRQCS
jgi:hypothetical protein